MRHETTEKINCVILNYNDVDTTISLVKSIYGYSCFHHIVVVDNASTDSSMEGLLQLKDDKVTVIASECNGGYGAGNNLGVHYSIRKDKADYVVIANPDTRFSEVCILEMAGILTRHNEVGVVAAAMEDAVYGKQRNGWRLHGFWGELLSMGPVSRRLFRRFLEYPLCHFQGKKAAYVDGVHGSMLMVRGKAFEACDGYDSNIFLYQEEAVLARRMKMAGYRTVLLADQSYRHEHSVSIGKTYRSQMARQRLRHESVMYYFKQYLHINRLQVLAAKCWFVGIMLEIFLKSALGTFVKCIGTKIKR